MTTIVDTFRKLQHCDTSPSKCLGRRMRSTIREQWRGSDRFDERRCGVTTAPVQPSAAPPTARLTYPKHARDTQDPACRESPSRHAVARTIRAKSEQLLCGGAYLSLIC